MGPCNSFPWWVLWEIIHLHIWKIEVSFKLDLELALSRGWAEFRAEQMVSLYRFLLYALISQQDILSTKVFFIYFIKFLVNKYFITILNERRGIFDKSDVGYELQTIKWYKRLYFIHKERKMKDCKIWQNGNATTG